VLCNSWGSLVISLASYFEFGLCNSTYRIRDNLHNGFRQRKHAVFPVCPVLVRSLLNLLEALHDLGSLVRRRNAVRVLAANGVARDARALCLFGEMCLGDLLVVLVDDLGRHTFHAEDLDLEALSPGVGILNMCEVLLVDLVHVHGETWIAVSKSRERYGRILPYRALEVMYLLPCLTAFHSGRI
jgi:hypothetical protein